MMKTVSSLLITLFSSDILSMQASISASLKRFLLFILCKERANDAHLQFLSLIFLRDAFVEKPHEVFVPILVNIDRDRRLLRHDNLLAAPLARGLIVLLAPLPLAWSLLLSLRLVINGILIVTAVTITLGVSLSSSLR